MAKHKISRRFHEQVEWAFRKQRNANLLAERGFHDCIVVLDGLNPSHNIGKIFRSGEVFGVREIHVINTPLFNVSPAKGAFKRVPAIFYDNFSDSYQALRQQGYTIYALYPDENHFVQTAELAPKAAFVVGHEENGLSFRPEQYPEVVPLAIAQYGVTQSLNVAVAASICLYEYAKQHGQSPDVSIK
ncbi:MAG: tRNA (guanine-N2)-dimethyltransferase [Gammaproteobacteria bacterium]|nr:MAG: tRNA (guanine-N2)-dimethyltransferase [Gammaproteobacteria bacterium]